MGNCMANATRGAVHSKSPSRTKRDLPAVDHHDARTTDTSSITDQSSFINKMPCSPPLKEREINIDNTSMADVSPLKGGDSHSRSSNSSTDTIEQQREEGQQKLRELVISGASSGVIDWKSIISLAEDLHKKEQRLLNSYKSSHNSRGVGTLPCAAGVVDENNPIGRRSNISRKQAFFEMRSKRRENARRAKLESVGSFSVNLLLYGADESTNICGERSNSQRDCDLPIDDHEDDVEQVDIYEEEESTSMSSQSEKPLSDESASKANVPNINSHSTSGAILEGSFLAATSMYTSLKFDEDDESSESSESDSPSPTTSFTGIELEKNPSWDDDGLITIHEDASVSLW